MHRLSLLAALLLLLLTGCTGGDSQDVASSAGAVGSSGEDAAAPEGAALSGAAPEAAGADPGTPTALGRVLPAGAELIRTADLTVRVEDVRAAADRAVEVAVTAGGVVTSERTSGRAEGREATLLLRVPPERFDDAVGQLADLGEELSRSLGTEDVTDQVVDLESRLATQRASVERVRALLDSAVDLGEVVQIEGELTRRTADLEALQARLAALTERVQLSSITLHLYGPQATAGPDDGVVGFGDGLRGGWAAFVATGRVLAATVGALLPFLPLLLAGALGWRLVRGRRTAASAP